MRPLLVRKLALFLALVGAACTAWAAPTATLQPPDKPIAVGDNSFTVVLGDETDTSSKVELVASMPPMGTMPYMESQGDIKKVGAGRYLGNVELTMGGTWDLTLTVSSKTASQVLRYTVTTGISGLVDKNSESLASSKTALVLGPARTQRIGVKIGEVKREKLFKTIRAVGTVEADPSQRAEVSLRIPGYVQKTSNRRVGEQVRAGTILAEIFSPELVSAQNEFLLGSHLLGGGNNSASSQERLLNLGMNRTDIAKMLATRKPLERISVAAPISGTILEADARDGAKIDAGQVLYVIGDLSKNYIIAKVFPSDMRELRQGMLAEITIPGESQQQLEAKIDLIFPGSNDPSGLTEIRLVVTQPNAAFKPGQYVDVAFSLPQKEALAVPQDAVLYSGQHTYVFRELQPGTLEAVEVVAGKRYGDSVVILSGLEEGQKIAVSGTFLLSSEANLRSALPKWKSTNNQ